MDVRNQGITNHVVQWTVRGSPTTCTLVIEKSQDAVSWSTVSTETCTAHVTWWAWDHLALLRRRLPLPVERTGGLVQTAAEGRVKATPVVLISPATWNI